MSHFLDHGAVPEEALGGQEPTIAILPPRHWLLAIGLVSLLLSFVTLGRADWQPPLVGYSIVVIGSFVPAAFYRRRTFERQNRNGLPPTALQRRLTTTLILVGLLAAILQSWYLARALEPYVSRWLGW